MEKASIVLSICVSLLVPRLGLAIDCDPADVPDATIIALQDGLIASPLEQIVMADPATDTVARRTEAYAFFESQFGLEFDPSLAGLQQASNNPEVVLIGLVTQNPVLPYQVLGIDAQAYPQLKQKFPLDSVEFAEDGYLVQIIGDTVLHGVYGGAAGRTVPAGEALIYGRYRLTNNTTGELIDTITFRSPEPIGTTFSGSTPIAHDVSSVLFGEGTTYGISRSMPEGNQFRALVRTVSVFPANRDLYDLEAEKECDEISSVNDDDDDDNGDDD